MSEEKDYSDRVYYNDGTKPDEDHPRAGWYCIIIEDGENRVFGPFVSADHATEFVEHCEEAYSHAH